MLGDAGFRDKLADCIFHRLRIDGRPLHLGVGFHRPDQCRRAGDADGRRHDDFRVGHTRGRECILIHIRGDIADVVGFDLNPVALRHRRDLAGRDRLRPDLGAVDDGAEIFMLVRVRHGHDGVLRQLVGCDVQQLHHLRLLGFRQIGAQRNKRRIAAAHRRHRTQHRGKSRRRGRNKRCDSAFHDGSTLLCR